MYNFVCQYCGKKFTTYVKSRRFCSISCATNFRASRKYPFRLAECLKHIEECKTQIGLKDKYPEDFRFCKYHNIEAFHQLPRGEKSKQKYSDEEIIEAAKKYTKKVDFLKKDKALYFSALHRGLLPTFTWLKSSANLFQSINYVYRYYFADYNAIYVGRTINPEQRDYEHRRDRGSESSIVFQYAQAHDTPIPKMEILEEGLSGEESQIKEAYYVDKYRGENILVLNSGATGLGSSSMGMKRYYTKKRFLALAHQCTNIQEFKARFPGAYRAGGRYKWLGELPFLQRKIRSSGILTKEFCISIARHYSSRKALQRGDAGVYSKMRRQGWLDECCWLKTSYGDRRVLTHDLCMEVARKHTTLTSLHKADPMVVKKLYKTRWIEECDWFLNRGKNLSARQ